MSDLLQVAVTSDVPPASVQRTCPECLSAFSPVQDTQLFCKPDHRIRWENRWTARGRRGMTLLVAARVTRSGSRGDVLFAPRASRDVDAMIRHWATEDRREKRMSVVEYVEHRYRLGFDPT